MITSPYLTGITIATALAGVAFSLVLTAFDPFTSGRIGVILFLVSGITFLYGALVLVLIAIYHRWRPDQNHFWSAIRQAGLLTFPVLAFLLLRLTHTLAWWNLLAVVLLCVVVEIYSQIKVE